MIWKQGFKDFSDKFRCFGLIYREEWSNFKLLPLASSHIGSIFTYWCDKFCRSMWNSSCIAAYTSIFMWFSRKGSILVVHMVEVVDFVDFVHLYLLLLAVRIPFIIPGRFQVSRCSSSNNWSHSFFHWTRISLSHMCVKSPEHIDYGLD